MNRYKVLVLDGEFLQAELAVRELADRGLEGVAAGSLASALALLRDDGTIHAVLTESAVPRQDGPDSSRVGGAELFAELLRLRYEVNLFLLTGQSDARLAVAGGVVNGYFFKGDGDWDDIARRVAAEVQSKGRAPFFDKLVEYARMAQDSWHTPGHASGFSVKSSPWVRDYHDFFGPNLFAADVSVSVPMLDSLLQPSGVIQEAQELAARAFSARYTFFSTNGTSTSNKVLLQTLVKPGEAVLLDRNCHKSVHYGVLISGAEPIYLLPSVNDAYGIFGPVPKARIFSTLDRALAAGKKVKALVLTNCTYDGLIYDIADIVEQCHRRQVKVMVDEAWFGYARFHPEFFPCAMEARADYATQSTHKTMSAFSQASMIHVRDPEFEELRELFLENYNMHASTSPQYPMIASLDVARRQMVMEGYSLLARALELSDSLRRAIDSLEKFRVLGLEDMIAPELAGDRVRLDRTKLTIDVSRSGLSSREVEHLLLSKHNIQIEKSTFNTLTVLITIGATQSRLNRLYLALESIERSSGRPHGPTTNGILKDFHLALSPIRFRPRQTFYCDGERLPLRQAAGRIATTMVVPYPPGIPLLVPGQLITPEIIEALQIYREYHVELHGLQEGLLKVATAGEEELLRQRGYAVEELPPEE